MHRSLALFAILFLAAAAPVQAAGGLAFQYTIEREREGALIESNFLRGFDLRDGLRLRVKVDQASYCYLITGDALGYRIAFPDPEARRIDVLAVDQWAKIPKSTFVRLGDDRGIERMYLVLATQRIPELDDALAAGALTPLEALALDVRDRYHAEGSYSRELDGPTISVKYHPRGSAAAVVVEEIALRARE